MIISITPGDGKLGIVKPGDEIKSFNRIRTDDVLNTLNVTNKNASLITTNLLKITQKCLKERNSRTFSKRYSNG